MNTIAARTRPVLALLACGVAILAGCTIVPHAAAPIPQFRLAWESGFELGFPGEWHPYDNGSWSPGGTMPEGRVSAWTIAPRDSGVPVYSGGHSYRSWIIAAAKESHRAYPVIHSGDANNVSDRIGSPLVNSFMVWLDADLDRMQGEEWIHLATWANNAEWKVHTLGVRNRKLEFAHTNPFHGEYLGPLPAPDFPLRRWVRITAYVEYNGPGGYVQVWQDGVPMLRAKVIVPGDTALLRAHWGLYAHPGVNRAVMYNDDIRIWTLTAPLSDRVTEPLPRL